MMRPPYPDPALTERFRRDVEALAGPAGDLVALAVSGGPDSLALLLLAAAAFPGRVAAATVDHGLRSEGAAEAAYVERVCEGFGVEHRTLTVRVEPGGEGVQAAARATRYRALSGWMRERGMQLLLTGHHADDQAETLLMRLMRGSGVSGLAGVRALGPLPGGGGQRLCRPLLSWRRHELAAVVTEAGLEAASDPSNRDPAYDRARLRARLREADWLDPVALARSAACLAEAEEALVWAAARLAEERIEARPGAAMLKPGGLPPELLRRLVLIALRRIAPDASPRGEALSAFMSALQSGRGATLAGVKASPAEGEWRFEPEPPRRMAPGDRLAG